MGSVVKLMNCVASSSIFTEFQKFLRTLILALVDPPAIGEKKAEDLADKILIKLEVKDFTEPVKKGTSWLRQLKMQHLVRRVVIMLALEAQLLDYDSNGNTTVKSSILHGVTVLKTTSKHVLAPNIDPEKLQTKCS
ncbi:hypothetical protein CFP56_003918 [Quercus suber]|uniref:Uncharacterized protein n=1 Tax=Quercus suber TaxID=58331 RepID=A0AAW0LBE9_QUESU